MSYALWFLLLVVQNAAFFSNGIWFASQLILIGFAISPGMSHEETMLLAVIYICGTVTGSVLMHWASIRWLESGKRKVGAA